MIGYGSLYLIEYKKQSLFYSIFSSLYLSYQGVTKKPEI